MWQAGGAAAAPGRPRRKPRKRPSAGRRHPRGADPGDPGLTASSRDSEAMSAIRQTNSKSLMLFSGRAYPELADEIGGHLGVTPTPTAAYEFANGELFVRFEESVRGCDAFVVQSHTAPINTSLMEQLIMVDALKRARPNHRGLRGALDRGGPPQGRVGNADHRRRPVLPKRPPGQKAPGPGADL